MSGPYGICLPMLLQVQPLPRAFCTDLNPSLPPFLSSSYCLFWSSSLLFTTILSDALGLLIYARALMVQNSRTHTRLNVYLILKILTRVSGKPEVYIAEIVVLIPCSLHLLYYFCFSLLRGNVLWNDMNSWSVILFSSLLCYFSCMVFLPT